MKFIQGGDLLAVRIRLSRAGAPKKPAYRIVVADSKMPRDGRFIEIVGRYNPRSDPSALEVDREKVIQWLAKGAKPTAAVEHLLKIAGIEKTAKKVETK